MFNIAIPKMKKLIADKLFFVFMYLLMYNNYWLEKHGGGGGGGGAVHLLLSWVSRILKRCDKLYCSLLHFQTQTEQHCGHHMQWQTAQRRGFAWDFSVAFQPAASPVWQLASKTMLLASCQGSCMSCCCTMTGWFLPTLRDSWFCKQLNRYITACDDVCLFIAQHSCNHCIMFRLHIQESLKCSFVWKVEGKRCSFVWKVEGKRCSFVWKVEGKRCSFVWKVEGKRCSFVWKVEGKRCSFVWKVEGKRCSFVWKVEGKRCS